MLSVHLVGQQIDVDRLGKLSPDELGFPNSSWAKQKKAVVLGETEASGNYDSIFSQILEMPIP